MRVAAPTAVSDRPIGPKDQLFWANQEAQKLFGQLRAAVNAINPELHSVDSAGAGAYVRIWTSDVLPTNCSMNVLADVSGVSLSGAAQRCGYLLKGSFESTASTVAQVGATTAIHAVESAAGIDVRFAVDVANRQVYLEGRDDAVSPMRFVARIDTGPEVTPL